MKRGFLPFADIDPEYVRVWTSYRRLRAIVFAFFILAMTEVLYIFLIPGIIFAMTFLAYFFTAAWLACWKCPRCSQPFFRFAFYRSLFGAKCFYCNLPKWGASETSQIIYRPRFPCSWCAVRRHDADSWNFVGPRSCMVECVLIFPP